jgi:hypothetical protein
LLASLPGCGSILGIDDLHPTSIKGALSALDQDNVRNAKVVFFDRSGTKVGETTTRDDGSYELPLTGQLPVNGYFEVKDPRVVHTVSYLLTPALDRIENSHDIQTLTPEGFAELVAAAGMSQGATSWLVVAQVVDDQGSTAVGAKILSAATEEDPTRQLGVCYSGRSGPDLTPCGGTSTGDDAFARIFDVPDSAALTISAVDADGGSHTISFPTVGGPGLVFTPIPPAP